MLAPQRAHRLERVGECASPASQALCLSGVRVGRSCVLDRPRSMVLRPRLGFASPYRPRYPLDFLLVGTIGTMIFLPFPVSICAHGGVLPVASSGSRSPEDSAQSSGGCPTGLCH